MIDEGDIIDVIKEAAQGVVNSNQPMRFVFGEVINTNPLTIQVNQKLTLTSGHLTLTRNVTSHTVSVKLPGETVYRNMTINNALKKYEKVVMLKNLKADGFLVLDRVVKAK